MSFIIFHNKLIKKNFQKDKNIDKFLTYSTIFRLNIILIILSTAIGCDTTLFLKLY